MNIHLIPPNTSASRITRIIAAGVVLVAVVLIGGFYYRYSHPPVDPTLSVNQPSPTQEKVAPAVSVSGAGLGADILDASKDPLGNKLPDSEVQVPNPMNALYKNPFN